MWLPKTDATTKGTRSGSVAIAIDNDKTSQNALKWTMENLTSRGQTLALIHVVPKSQSSSDIEEGITHKQQLEKQTKHLFVSFHCFCSRKEINCLDVVLEDVDKVKAIVEYVTVSAIENLVLGAPSRNSFMRRFKTDLPTSVSKAAPDFCNVYVIAKSKISSLRSSSRPAPYHPSVLSEFDNHETSENRHKTRETTTPAYSKARRSVDSDVPRSVFAKPPQGHMKVMGDFSDSESEFSFISASQQGSDISYISSGRPSVDRSSFTYDLPDSARTSRMSTSSEQSMGSNRLGIKFTDLGFLNNASSASEESGRTSCSYSSQSLGDVEAQMRRLRLELKQTMDMYSSACREALTARNEATELQRLRSEEERRMEELKMTEETAMSMVEKERAKARTATEAAEAARRLAEAEAKRRLNAEMKVLQENDSFPRHSIVRYRKYSVKEIEEGTANFAESRKVGEGGYGPVFRGHLDHTSVAVKVLRPDAAQGRSQFHKEVEVLSCIRHPNMVLLLGACPEYGILVYEYMAKGSLDDRLFRRGNTPAISWQLRFRIAAEIATGLLFLHQTKPEPIVHRDLKPGNVLLDHNYVSKISDVGLARLVPAVAENVTQYRATSAAGTFCYIDPEYQQTGMLGVKSDVYSLGIMLLQLLTAKQPMGLAYYVEQAIEEGKLKEMLDPAVPDWPLEEAMDLAKLSLQCAELRRRDRPDLGKEVMPVLNRLREMGEESLESVYYAGHGPMSHSSQVSYISEGRSAPYISNAGSSISNGGSSMSNPSV
ncbi:U-box domain-containing protein 35 [Raphanus sativus]|uniref:RING-type E3 ubiquitin transferase n=1 Tax=Raphanus sativus TaxID=3726 RepID=A0A9W3CC37_RAPSA|nr:U-box domain-containing protein 35 [Raphanus sativus]